VKNSPNPFLVNINAYILPWKKVAPKNLGNIYTFLKTAQSQENSPNLVTLITKLCIQALNQEKNASVNFRSQGFDFH
jgi:hypothetical protein